MSKRLHSAQLAVLCIASFNVLCCGDDDSPGPTDRDGAIRDGATKDVQMSRDARDLPDGDGASTEGGRDAQADARTSAQPATVYVTVGSEERLAVVTLSESGALIERVGDSLKLSGKPGAMGRDPNTGRLFVGLENGDLESVAVDESGRPTSLGTTDVSGQPVYVAVSETGEHIVTAYFGQDEVRAYSALGEPPHSQTDQNAASDEPHAAQLAPNGKFYVPHRNGQVTYWYSLSNDGKLQKDGELGAPSGVGPRHIAFTSSGTYAYIANEFGLSVSAHRVAANGSLDRFETLSALPQGTDPSGSTCADVHVTPDAKFLYVSNRGHNTIAGFSIGADGSLTFLNAWPTESVPREFDISPDGRWLVSLGQQSGFIVSYRIEGDGSLTQIDRLELGGGLLWAHIVQASP